MGRVLAEVGAARVKRLRASTVARLDVERQNLNAWAMRFGVTPQLQGWLKTDGLEKIGAWGEVEETPGELGREAVFPLISLIPDRNDKKHAGQYGTIFFGLLPTGTGETDDRGQARFDDQNYYEVRCFVKRHKKPHDRGSPCQCPDGIFWSLPTRPYKLAPHFDLAGTSHQPVTVQLPDLNELAAQAKPALGVGFAKPPGSLMFSVDSSGKASDKGASTIPEICFFPIPLITIVAMFVFELFLPIIMFIFQLWWMLALKFCIPPDLQVAAGINAELQFDATTDLNALEATINTTDLSAKLTASFGAQATANLKTAYSPIALANMDFDVSAAGSTTPAVSGAPTPSASLDFEPEVTHV
jgi:hypothetical protein